MSNNPLHFGDTGSSGQYAVDNIDVTEVSPYKFVSDAYYAKDGFFTGRYLHPHEREYSYVDRRKMAAYKNYLRDIVDSIVNPPFVEKADRNSNSKLWDAYIENCDNAGTHIQDKTRTNVLKTTMHGTGFTVMDNFTEDELADNKASEIADRKFPYSYIKTMETLDDDNTIIDMYGNIDVAGFFYDIVEHEGSKVNRYKLWTKEYSVWYVKDSNSDNGITEIASRHIHNLGVVPVIVTKFELGDDVYVMPPVYGMAKLSLQMFDQGSETRDLSRAQSFSTLVLPTLDISTTIEMGSRNVIGVDPNATVQPNYISPDSSILTSNVEVESRDKEDLFSMANAMGAMAVKNNNQTKSGTALSFEMIGTNWALKRTSRIAELKEMKEAEIFGLYVGETIDYTVVYQDNFAPTFDDLNNNFSLMERVFDLDVDQVIKKSVELKLVDLLSLAFDYTDDEVTALKNNINEARVIESSIIDSAKDDEDIGEVEETEDE